MLKPSTIVPSNGISDAVIAGSGGGIKVHCSQQALPVYNTLVGIAQSGNHHARLAVSGIVGLSSGHMHMDNVYKPNSKALSSTRKDLMSAVLPGILILFKQQDNGSVIILSIKIDDTYTKQQREHTSPGLWNVAKERGNRWAADFVEDGKLNSDAKNRFVIVSDRSKNTPRKTAAEIFDVLQSSRDKTTLNQISRDGFDLHFTPGKVRIGGMKNLQEARHADSQASLKESAEILAHTMYNARDISGVVWGSERGGSGVLTQAMQILVNQGVELKTHGIFLNRATTLPSKAIELARKLGIESNDISKKSTVFSLDQLAGQLCFFDTPISNFQRVKNDDNYSMSDLSKDTAKGIFNSVNDTNTMIGAGGLLGATLAASPVVTTVGGILAFTTVMIKLAQNTIPEASRKHIGRN